MATLEPNGERGRVKTGRRRKWAKPLIRPQTVKVVIEIGKWIVQILQLVETIIKVFRN